ncbi:MAG: protein kinase [Planctomycetota bacterium]
MTERSAQSRARVEALVEKALQLQEDGVPFSIDELCADAPEYAKFVAAALGAQHEIDAWASGGRGSDPLDGRVLGGRYRLEGVIGAGAMGAVYRAYDPQLKRAVAVKVLQPHLFGADDAERRFLRETEILATLDHPHVVAVFDRGATGDGRLFSVMELVRGAPLSTILDALAERVTAHGWDALSKLDWLEEIVRRGVAEDPALGSPRRSAASGETTALAVGLVDDGYYRLCARWAAQLAEGLAAAHAAGVYHRDVKPSNVFIHVDGRALLLDFGVAARRDDATLTRGDTTLGTPKYMPPEQARGRGEPGPKLDLYSLGATLYHMLAARAPYEGEVAAVLTALQREEPPRLDKLHPAVPVDLQAVVECAMAREPNRRYADAAAMAADLRAFLEHRPVQARRRGPMARAVARLRRSRVAHVVSLAVVLTAVSLGVPAWIEARSATRRVAAAEIWRSLPPTLTLGEQPVVTDAGRRDALGARLDRMVELAPERPLPRSIRAAFRFDHGDLGGAAADYAELARRAGPFAAALAQRYEEVAVSGSANALRLDALPEPAGDADLIVAGHLALRQLAYDRAVDLLEPASRGDLMARELWLLAELVDALARRDTSELQALYDQALLVEGAYAAPSTRTRHVMGTAMVAQRRFAEAVEPLEGLIELAPDSYPTLVNLGTAYRRLGDLGAACEVLERALQLRPDSTKAATTLAKVLATRGEYDAALRAAQRIPEAGPDGWRCREAQGYVEMMRSVALLAREQDTVAVDAATTSLEHFKAAIALGYDTRVMRMNVAACQSLIDGDHGRLCVTLCELLADDPFNAVHLQNLARRLPAQLSADGFRSLRRFLAALARAVEEPR